MARYAVEPPTYRFSVHRMSVHAAPDVAPVLVSADAATSVTGLNGPELRRELRRIERCIDTPVDGGQRFVPLLPSSMSRTAWTATGAQVGSPVACHRQRTSWAASRGTA